MDKWVIVEIEIDSLEEIDNHQDKDNNLSMSISVIWMKKELSEEQALTTSNLNKRNNIKALPLSE